MNFLRKLFGGGADRGGDKEGMYFYVRSQRSGEVIQVRLHRFNDLSLTEDGRGYYVRKLATGSRGYDQVELELHFDQKRNFLSANITGGDLVERADYEAFLAQQEAEN
jgi:hypothetical protein